MKLFLNIFLISFLIDSGISVTNELVVLFADSGIFSAVQHSFSVFVVLISIPVYIALGINASIPKKFILPLIFFLIWAIATAQPLPLFIDDNYRYIILSLIQLSLSLAIFVFIRRKSSSWLITDTVLSKFSFRIKNTLGFLAGNIIILPVVTLIIVFVSIQTFLSHKTGGFLRLSTDGIFMTEKIYKKNNKSIKLIGMIHIGEENYYKSLTDSISNSDSIVLAEGVSDKDNLIKNGFSTKGFAKMYGLSSQEDMSLNGDLISPDQLISSDFSDTGGKLNIIRADVDINSFSQDTIDFLNMAGEYIFREESFAAGINEYNNWIKVNNSPSFVANLTFDILGKRNKRVISLIDPAIDKFNIVIVPWGAMHMPAIEKAVQTKGFSLVKTNERQSMEFSIDRLKKIVSTIQLHPI